MVFWWCGKLKQKIEFFLIGDKNEMCNDQEILKQFIDNMKMCVRQYKIAGVSGLENISEFLEKIEVDKVDAQETVLFMTRYFESIEREMG